MTDSKTVPAPPADSNLAEIRPGRYTIDASHTRVLFSVSHMGFSTYYGELTGASGELVIDPRKLANSRFEMSVPTANVTTTNATLDGELKSAEWLDAERYPTIDMHTTQVTGTGGGRAKVTGDLGLHGVTRPVMLDVQFNGGGVNPLDKAYTIGFEALTSRPRPTVRGRSSTPAKYCGLLAPPKLVDFPGR